jgi:hypothetical protein
MREVGLRRLGVVFDGADAATEWDPDHHRDADLALRPVVHLGDLGHDLVVGRVDEAVELDLTDRPVPSDRQADGGADDARLGQRRVDHPLLAEVLLQPVGDPEDAAELADVFAHDDDLVVGLQGPPQAEVEGLAEGVDLRHEWLPSNEARYFACRSRCSATSGSPSG